MIDGLDGPGDAFEEGLLESYWEVGSVEMSGFNDWLGRTDLSGLA
jgi:hypothetical protein